MCRYIWGDICIDIDVNTYGYQHYTCMCHALGNAQHVLGMHSSTGTSNIGLKDLKIEFFLDAFWVLVVHIFFWHVVFECNVPSHNMCARGQVCGSA